jgi:hypothetical protein
VEKPVGQNLIILNRHDVQSAIINHIGTDGFGGLLVSMLASGTRVRGFNPGPKPLDFSGVVKILKHDLPSEGK